MEQLRLYLFTLKIILKGQNRLFFHYTWLTIIESLFPVFQIYLLKLLTDEITFILKGSHSLLNSINIVLAQLVLFILSYLITNIKNLLKTRITQNSNFNMDVLIVRQLNKLPLIYFEETENHNLIKRVSSGIGNKAISGFISILDIIKYMIMLIGYTVLLFKIHWTLSVLLILLLLPSIRAKIGISKDQYLQVQSQTHMIRRSNYLFSLFSDKTVQKELKIFNHSEYLFNLWKSYFWKAADEQYTLEKKITKIQSINIILNHIISTLYVIGLIVFGRGNGMTIGDFVAYSQLLSLGTNCIQFLSNSIGTFANQSLFLTEYKSFLNSEITDHDTPRNTKHKHSTNTHGIKFDNVSFNYPSNNEETLKNISFEILPGEMVAIVGDNGSGKSTLIKCLAGLYSPQKGDIYYNGINLKAIPTSDVLKKFTVLFQDYFKYELSVKENIILSNDTNEFDKTQFKKAILNSDLSDLIKLLPNKEFTELGLTFNHGTELSGGQWQRIALSRSLYKDAEVIILDEPTAAIDPMSEAKLLHSFHEICKGKTSIIVTHRLASCVKADKIIVLRDGKIVEIGTHRQLILADGVYTEMFNSQASSYINSKNDLAISNNY